MRTWLAVCAGILAAVSTPTHACTWEGLSLENVDERLPHMIAGADRIVHGRVTWVSDDGLAARIESIRTFKGPSGAFKATSGLLCGHIFKVGEEMIYFVHGSDLSAPRTSPVADWLLASLEKTVGGTQ
jgi:hypothetical protein